ncbi:magnesium chelatase domain-containing protein [Streptomyces sp. NPDC047070]|uniref:magnesium chelatase domain-containing protein n=1 Tax=Streptomyces sp. NPDC047070 TaxID=3154923 RepID=UPI0034568558
MSATLTEFIIVGQCQGTGYTLWDIAPAPVDPTRRAVALEELGVDAMDAFGSVETVHGATPREAVANFLAQMREQSGLDDYDLTADSRTDTLENLENLRDDATHAVAAGRTGLARIKVTVNAGGTYGLQIHGKHDLDPGAEGRILNGIYGGGLTVPDGAVRVAIDDHRNLTATLDLAIACAILGAAGEVDEHALQQTVILGELGHGGSVETLPGVPEAARAARDAGYRAVMVPASWLRDVRREVPGINVIGVRHLRDAVRFLGAPTEGIRQAPAGL